MISGDSKPSDIVRWTIEAYPDAVITTGLNLSGTVLIDMFSKQGYTGKVLFVDTGYHFPETIEFWNLMERTHLNISFVRLQPNMDRRFRFDTDPKGCCADNKVAPLVSFLDDHRCSAVVSGRTRESAITRANLTVFEPGNPVRINPLAATPRRDLEAYARENALMIHPLYLEGFISIGCWPCTRAVRQGEDTRSGRFEGQGRTECGIWPSLESGDLAGSPEHEC